MAHRLHGNWPSLNDWDKIFTMMPLILLVGFFLSAPQVAMECQNTGAATSTVHTEPVRGPDGASAVLKVSSADDHSKNSHLCNAEYELLVTPAAGGSPTTVSLIISNADYGRTLSLRLDGFSQDGKRVFGIFSEGGKYSSTTLFAYDAGTGTVQLTDLKKPLARIVPAKCSAEFNIIGTTESGAVVLELSSPNQCAPQGRWQVNTGSQKLSRLPQDAAILSLYEPKAMP
jgi:hypothetical protein